MHYYKRNIGDYAKKAGRLSMLEHGAYTLLMDACYDREKFPTEEEAIEWTWSRDDAEINAVKFVLSRFFEKQEDGTYVQPRIKEEIDNYHAMAEKNKQIAKERERKRRKREQSDDDISEKDNETTPSVNGSSPSVNEPPPNHKPRTNNQEPITISKKTIGEWFDNFWSLYPNKQNKKKARDKFFQIVKSKDDYNTLIAGLSRQREFLLYEHNREQNKSFCPHPTTWLNGNRWEDEVKFNPGVSNANDYSSNKKLSKAQQTLMQGDADFIAEYGRQTPAMRTVS